MADIEIDLNTLALILAALFVLWYKRDLLGFGGDDKPVVAAAAAFDADGESKLKVGNKAYEETDDDFVVKMKRGVSAKVQGEQRSGLT